LWSAIGGFSVRFKYRVLFLNIRVKGMAVEKLKCMICGTEVDFDTIHMKEFIENRVWVLEKGNPIHDCGHLSHFGHSEPEYAAFLYRLNDEPAKLMGELGFSKWKGKVILHPAQEGVEDEDYFKRVLNRLLDEIAFIMRSPKVENKREKIELLVTHKLEGYKERVE
jgi:hypothetical protein